MTKDTYKAAFKDNFVAIMDIPIVKSIVNENKKLIKKNKKLKKKNKALKNFIYMLPEFRNKSVDTIQDVPVVHIKQEKMDCEVDDDEIEIVEPVEKENIVYDIIEHDNVPEKEIPSTESPPEEETRYVVCDNCDYYDELLLLCVIIVVSRMVMVIK